jgi:hypothetical protein
MKILVDDQSDLLTIWQVALLYLPWILLPTKHTHYFYMYTVYVNIVFAIQ